DQGGLGIEVFDSDQLRVGGDLRPGASALQSWNGTTWVAISFDDHGQPVAFDWNKPHIVGVRFDSADGRRATFSYYLDGQYAGSGSSPRATQRSTRLVSMPSQRRREPRSSLAT